MRLIPRYRHGPSLSGVLRQPLPVALPVRSAAAFQDRLPIDPQVLPSAAQLTRRQLYEMLAQAVRNTG